MAFSDPQHNIEQLGLSEGMKVADFGAGSGHYTLAAARVVGSEGRVYAVDVQQDLLTRIQSEAQSIDLQNVEIIWADLERDGSTRLADQSIDVVFLSNTLFQAENKESLFKEARRVLRPKGRLLVIDWTDSFGGLGPPGGHIVTESVAKALAEKVGLKVENSIMAGDHHYGFVARRSK